MSKLPDPFREGLARGWKTTNGETGLPAEIQCDVAIVGSGAGAGITAELLTKAGQGILNVLDRLFLFSKPGFVLRKSQAA